jgi:Flp pilus assembly protein TadD
MRADRIYNSLAIGPLAILNLGLEACRTNLSSESQNIAVKELAAAMAARQKADYSTAFKHAQKAVELDPGMTVAHLDLAIIADEMRVPNGLTDKENTICPLAIQEYKHVIAAEKSNTEALKGLAYLLTQFGRWDESERYYRAAFALIKTDPGRFLRCGRLRLGPSSGGHAEEISPK